MTDVRSMLWHGLAQRMTPSVQQVVEFAKRLPGFHGLPQDDQLILIKVCILPTEIPSWTPVFGRMFDFGRLFSRDSLALIIVTSVNRTGFPQVGLWVLFPLWNKMHKFQTSDTYYCSYRVTSQYFSYWYYKKMYYGTKRLLTYI